MAVVGSLVVRLWLPVDSRIRNNLAVSVGMGRFELPTPCSQSQQERSWPVSTGLKLGYSRR